MDSFVSNVVLSDCFFITKWCIFRKGFNTDFSDSHLYWFRNRKMIDFLFLISFEACCSLCWIYNCGSYRLTHYYHWFWRRFLERDHNLYNQHWTHFHNWHRGRQISKNLKHLVYVLSSLEFLHVLITIKFLCHFWLIQ